MSQQIDIPGVGLVEFPDGMTDADIAAAASKLHRDAQPRESSVGALAPAAVAPAANLAMRFGTSPTAAKTGGAFIRGAAELASPLVGAYEGGARGLLAGTLAAPAAGWIAGRNGYRLVGRLQAPARALASGLETIAPAMSQISGASGVGDLAQMAEPTRRDIGFMGIGSGTPDPKDPAMLNALYDRLHAFFTR